VRAYFPPRDDFFLFSAHRFFIKYDRRLRPSGVRRSTFSGGGAAGDDLRGAAVESVSSRARMARLSRSRSRFSSFTIAWVSKSSSLVNSFGVLRQGRVACSQIAGPCPFGGKRRIRLVNTALRIAPILQQRLSLSMLLGSMPCYKLIAMSRQFSLVPSGITGTKRRGIGQPATEAF